MLNTTYYWRVDSTIGGNIVTGPTWRFTTITGEAGNVSPADGHQKVSPGRINLRWIVLMRTHHLQTELIMMFISPLTKVK